MTNQPIAGNELDPNISALEADMVRLEEAKLRQQRANEINTAIRCLTTNLYLCLILIVGLVLASVLSQLQALAVTALLKTFVPIFATISNFVKIHTLVIETFLDCKNKLTSQLLEMKTLRFN
jgi:hypothetical protein